MPRGCGSLWLYGRLREEISGECFWSNICIGDKGRTRSKDKQAMRSVDKAPLSAYFLSGTSLTKNSNICNASDNLCTRKKERDTVLVRHVLIPGKFSLIRH